MCPTAPQSVSHIVTCNYLPNMRNKVTLSCFFKMTSSHSYLAKSSFYLIRNYKIAVPKDAVTKNSGMTHYITVWLLNVQLLKRK